jgi:hypothetical protein
VPTFQRLARSLSGIGASDGRTRRWAAPVTPLPGCVEAGGSLAGNVISNSMDRIRSCSSFDLRCRLASLIVNSRSRASFDSYVAVIKATCQLPAAARLEDRGGHPHSVARLARRASVFLPIGARVALAAWCAKSRVGPSDGDRSARLAPRRTPAARGLSRSPITPPAMAPPALPLESAATSAWRRESSSAAWRESRAPEYPTDSASDSSDARAGRE